MFISVSSFGGIGPILHSGMLTSWPSKNWYFKLFRKILCWFKDHGAPFKWRLPRM